MKTLTELLAEMRRLHPDADQRPRRAEQPYSREDAEMKRAEQNRDRRRDHD